MTDADERLDALMDECSVFLIGFPQLGKSLNTFEHIMVNAFPAGARARLEIMNHEGPDVWRDFNGVTTPTEKYNEADRLVTECERLQRGESK